MRHRKDSQILSTSWLKLCRPTEGVGGAKQCCLCFGLKNITPIWTMWHPVISNVKGNALFLSERKARILEQGPSLFPMQTKCSIRWENTRTRILQSIPIDFHSKDARTSRLFSFQTLRCLWWDQSRQISITPSRWSLWQSRSISGAHQRAFKNGEQRICAYQMKALGRESEWHKHVMRDEQHLV